MEELRGIHAVNVTPFQEDGTINYDHLEVNIEFLLDNGLNVVVPCGNTGEFYSLSIKEAKAVTRFVVEKAEGRAKVLAGVGYDLETAEEMAFFAQNAGADAVMVHQPIHPYLMTKGLVRYYTHIAQSLDIGVVLYVRREAVNQEVLNRVTALDNVVAIKYAINDLPLFGRVVQSVENPVVWVCGTAEMWAPFFFAAGAEGFTSGLVNIAPEKSPAMLKGLEEGNRKLVQAVWKEIVPLERLRAKHHDGNNVTVIKEGMNLTGRPGGRVREPISELDEADRQELVRILTTWNKI
jgi:4-hydroxy-tetrahydrodipicolinate synthase